MDLNILFLLQIRLAPVVKKDSFFRTQMVQIIITTKQITGELNIIRAIEFN